MGPERLSLKEQPGDALATVRNLAEVAANQRQSSLVDSGLRLFDHPDRLASPWSMAPQEATELVSPFDLGRSYELLLAPGARRRRGTHLTPEAVARKLLAMLPPPQATTTVLDPAVGGAAFLLASADQLTARGARPERVLDQLHGFDIDEGAVAVAEAALAIWAIDNGVPPRSLPNLRCADGLLDPLPTVDRVVGNPPFLNQLQAGSSHTAQRRELLRERWGDLIGTYTDDAWLFLAAGIDALTEDGSLALVQPVSILAARHGESIRAHAQHHAALSGLWIAVDQVFDAAVHVCGVVFDKDRTRSTPAVERCRGADFAPMSAVNAQPLSTEWGSVAAAAIDIPEVRFTPSTRTIGDLAAATAGFRDQFYGFVPFVSEADADAGATASTADTAPLVTVGMIDVLGLSWGAREFKFAKKPFRRPVVDLDALKRDDPTLAAWVQARQRPKLLVATQTRVIEVWVDTEGRAVPATPVLSVEPYETDADTLWLLAAALSAPVLSAHFLAKKFGTAMALNSMKLAARDVLQAPLPTDETAWRDAAAILRHSEPDFGEFARTIDAAYGVDDPQLVNWWRSRFPNGSNRNA